MSYSLQLATGSVHEASLATIVASGCLRPPFFCTRIYIGWGGVDYLPSPEIFQLNLIRVIFGKLLVARLVVAGHKAVLCGHLVLHLQHLPMALIRLSPPLFIIRG